MTTPSATASQWPAILTPSIGQQRRGENGRADHHERRDGQRVHARHGALGQQQVQAPAGAGQQRQQHPDAGGRTRGTGEDDDARAGQHDPQPVELAPRAEHGDAERADELDGDDDADGHAADRAVEAEVHDEEGQCERRQRQAVALGRQPSERARPDEHENECGESGAQPERLEHTDRLDDLHGQRRARLDGEGEDDDEGGGGRRVAATALVRPPDVLPVESFQESTQARPPAASAAIMHQPCIRGL